MDHSAPKIPGMAEYVVALCHMGGEGELLPFESTRFLALDKSGAMQKANQWASTAVVGPIERPTWLQVILNGRSIYSKELF